jgi:two-component system alkaline phosphatase synthesis response regulator PhoP
MPDKKVKVLLVEDDPAISDMYKLRFEEEGFTVLITDKGSEAIDLSKSEKPDIILLDVILPEIDGFAVLQAIKAETSTKNIPIMMLTNLSQETDQDKGREFGAAGYLVKSQHTPADVLTEIKKVLS